MRLDNLTKLSETMPLLTHCFSRENTVAQDAEIVGKWISAFFPVERVGLVLLDQQRGPWMSGASFYPHTGGEGELEGSFAQALLPQARAWEQACQGPSLLLDRTLWKDPAGTVVHSPLLCKLQGEDCPWALLVLEKPGLWEQEDREVGEYLSALLSLVFTLRKCWRTEELTDYVFNALLDGVKASIYVTDPQTDEILFMNQTMKEEFQLEKPEGQICWKVLQCQGFDRRCPFCPVPALLSDGENHPVLQWEEINTRNGRIYQNYDSLIQWVDGRMVHLQHSIDITELKFANTDELTQMMTRRAGKAALEETLERGVRQNGMVTVALYDINSLKEVNDTYGHTAGDQLISTVATEVRSQLGEAEYAFRLSGDEFVVVFQGGVGESRRRLEEVVEQLHHQETHYSMGFSYGLVEVDPDRPMTVDEVLLLADERMYDQKRKFHILINARKMGGKSLQALTDTERYDMQKFYRAIVESTDDYVYVCNMKTGVFRYTRPMVQEFGLPSEVVENAAAVWGGKVHPEDRQAFLESNQDIAEGRATSHCVEYRAQNRHGEWVWVRCRGHLELDENGAPELFAGFITNLGKKNTIDHLTGLYNKLEFEDAIVHLIEEGESPFGVILLGIDDLKHINDLYDRNFGDEVIRITSQRIQSLLPTKGSLYRMDGDEFAVIVRDGNREVIEEFYRALSHCLDSQQEYEGKRYYSTLSGGALFYPQDAHSFLDLMKYGGYSLEYAKNHGKKRCVFFSREILSHKIRALELTEELRASVENGFEGFSLRFQPLVRAQSGALIGVEALARWQCPRFGMVSPMEFIPLLEQSGMIVPVGKWVFRSVLKSSRPWCRLLPDFVAHVNLSYIQIRDPEFVSFLRGALEQEQYSATNLVVELTESHFAEINQRIQTVFDEIHDLGVRIAIDDFGTGYSTLGILKDSPADIVKIDKTFIRDILTSNFDATFIRFIVALCHDVGIEVCQEGVETEEEYTIVSRMMLDTIQGYYFDKPLTKEEFLQKYFPGEAV